MDVFSGDAVGEGRVRWSDGFFGSGRDAERVGGFGSGLDSVVQTVLQEELEEHAVELHSHTWHFSLSSHSTVTQHSLPFLIYFFLSLKIMFYFLFLETGMNLKQILPPPFLFRFYL